MHKRLEAGNSNSEAVFILVVVFLIVLVLPRFITSRDNPRPERSLQSNSETIRPEVEESGYEGKISISTGNARREYQSYKEYITLKNRSKEPINITGWQLKNAKDERPYNISGELRYFSSDSVSIPQASLFISPTGGTLPLQDIILEPGETAIITTGRIGIQAPYKITSFKENICSGYIENLDEYDFTPSLKRSCPDPGDEAGIIALDVECRKFIDRMPRCHTPEYETRDDEGDICTNCVDDKPLSNACVAFIKNHFSYGSCLANHLGDENFYEKRWRVFLNNDWELWAKEYETIYLLDKLGELVDSKSWR